MAVVFSELQEDYFLSSIMTNIFTDIEPEPVIDEAPPYAETTFDIAKACESDSGQMYITLEHCISSTVDMVGMQLWRGAFLLADFLLSHPGLVTGRKVLELAAGTGLTAVTAGMLAESVTATDVDRGEILSLLKRNGSRNKCQISNCNWEVKEMDFFWDSWTEDIEKAVADSQVVLAADVVYDKDITKHFFKTLKKILSYPPKLAFIAIEKRERTGCEGAIIAPNFEYFLENLSNLHLTNPSSTVTIKVTEESTKFPQYFNYTRVQTLTLWKIESNLT